MSYIFTPPLAIGSQDTGDFSGMLGDTYFAANGKAYMLVKASVAISSPGGKAVVDTVSSDVHTYAVVVSATKGDPLSCGVIPNEYTSTIAASAAFWVQVSGPIEAVIGSATVSSGPLRVGTAGWLEGFTGLYTEKVVAWFINSAAATAAGGKALVQLAGIL
jgi:hypothetical protein